MFLIEHVASIEFLYITLIIVYVEGAPAYCVKKHISSIEFSYITLVLVYVEDIPV